MPDDKVNTGGQHRKRINTGEDHEVRDWASKFGCSTEELLEAVKRVGNLAEDVEADLKQLADVGCPVCQWHSNNSHLW